MFTGIIETTGLVTEIIHEQTNVHFWVETNIAHELKIDQSVAHNGVCLTVIQINGNKHCVTAVAETLNKTNLGQLAVNNIVNIERCMPANGRFDGHIVQGHVDTTAKVVNIKDENGSWLVYFEFEDNANNHLMVDKGSICVNGVSLTIVKAIQNTFYVTIIPYTWEHTNFKSLKVGDWVNIEFDIVGKYILKMQGKQ